MSTGRKLPESTRRALAARAAAADRHEEDVVQPANPFAKYFLFMRTMHSDMIRLLLETLKEILSDVNIEFDEDMITISSIDALNISYTNVKLYAEKIRVDGEYYCRPPENKKNILAGVNMTFFHRMFKTVSKDDIITLYILRDDPDRLHVVVKNKLGKYSSNFSMNLIDVDVENTKLKKMDFNLIVTIPSQDLHKHCRDLTAMGDYVRIRHDGNFLVLTARGENASREVIIQAPRVSDDDEAATLTDADRQAIVAYYADQHKDQSIIDVEALLPPLPEAEQFDMQYNVKYLTMFTRATNISSSVNINMHQDMPLVLLYDVAGLGEIRFVLSSKKSDADDA